MSLEPINYYFDPEKNIPATKLVKQVLQILKRRLGLPITLHIPRIKHIINGADVPADIENLYQAAIDTNGLVQIISDGKTTIIAFDGTRLDYTDILLQLERIIDSASDNPPTLVVWEWAVDFLKREENQAFDLSAYKRPHPEISIDQAMITHKDRNPYVRRINTATATYYIYLK